MALTHVRPWDPTTRDEGCNREVKGSGETPEMKITPQIAFSLAEMSANQQSQLSLLETPH